MQYHLKEWVVKTREKLTGWLKYHPQLVTMGQSVDLDGIAYIMKDKSSLSLGDIQSVLTNYVEAMRAALFDGKSVNIRDFGVFSLSAIRWEQPRKKSVR